MPCDRRRSGRRHTDDSKCQKCGKKECNMHYCSEEYRTFFERQSEIESELNNLFVSIRDFLDRNKV